MAGRALQAGFLYFLLVFGAGFVLGPLRILFLVPRVGVRAAELIELPVMLFISWLSAGWLVRRLRVPPSLSLRFVMGILALALLLVAEFSLVLPLRGLTFAEYLATRDPVSGPAYYAALLVMALIPLLSERN
jgi:hypothetical protein